jgi:2-keto-4-pentenoate hydratase/2-oxohepta-3-ene-1,7-dioic acid hydratase in catechol pathway
MRLGQFSEADDDRPWTGVVSDDGVVEVAAAADAAGVDLPQTTSAMLATWKWREKVALAVDYGTETGVGVRDADAVERIAPVHDPGTVVGVGLNYRDHAEEGGEDVPEEPVLFAKFPTAVTGPNSEIRWDPELTSEVDYEAELVAVVGREARDVEPGEAMAHVAGFTVGNDVSARDLQFSDDQWVRGKSLDTFAPVGPDLVTTDEVGDPHDLDIWAEVDGDRLQDSTTANLAFGVDELVSFCSRAFTLRPGDLLFTGTPAGVGAFRDPPVYLDDGTSVTVGVEGVGELTNTCRHR